MNAQALPTDSAQTRSYPRIFMLWQSRGVSARASSVLALTNVDTAEQIAQLGRAHFEGLPNCGPKTIAELAQLGGWPAKTPRDAIAQVLRLSLTHPDEAEDVADDIMIALRRNRFAVVAPRRSEPPGRRRLAE